MPIPLTDALRRELQQVQDQVNAACDYTVNAPDDWGGAAAFVTLGDCKNFAADKMGRLIALDVPAADLRLCCCYVEPPETSLPGQYHCVLLVDTEGGVFVLDQRQMAVARLEDLKGWGYHGLVYQTADKRGWESGPF